MLVHCVNNFIWGIEHLSSNLKLSKLDIKRSRDQGIKRSRDQEIQRSRDPELPILLTKCPTSG